MEQILLSIHPIWCKKIADGKKTFEIRKAKPQLSVPFEVFIYCTKNSRSHFHLYTNTGVGRQKQSGKETDFWGTYRQIIHVNPHLSAYAYDALLAEGSVIAKFVCDKTVRIAWSTGKSKYLLDESTLEQTCLTQQQLYDYGKGAPLYGWHISKLEVFPEPRPLSEFGFKRAPQTWFAVKSQETEVSDAQKY